MISAVVRALVAKGAAPEMILAAVEAAEAAMQGGPSKAKRAARNARYYGSRKTVKTPEASEKRLTAPPPEASESVLKRLNSDAPRAYKVISLSSGSLPESRKKGEKKESPRGELLRVLDPLHADAVLAHRKALRKPLTVRAATLLAGKLEASGDANAAADQMVERGWQGYDPTWSSPRSPPYGGSSKPTLGDILRASEAVLERETQNDREPAGAQIITLTSRQGADFFRDYEDADRFSGSTR